jgi:hypothetical protein
MARRKRWQNNWDNGKSRTLEVVEDPVTDSKDSRVTLIDVGEPSPKAIIDGQGECTLTGGSPRLYINGKYQNVEFEVEIQAVENTSQVYLSARSNHEQRPNGFGGYPLFIDVEEKRMFFKKEQTHKIGYSDRLASVDVPYNAGEWFKARVRITNIAGGKVKCKAWFNDRTSTTLIDSGQITCGGQTNTAPFTGFGESCFFRVNSNGTNINVKVKYRNAKIWAIQT